MALDIPALARDGLALAFSVAATAASNVVLYTSPIRGAYTPATDTTSITWTETTGKAFVYDVERSAIDAGNQEEFSAWVSGRMRQVLIQSSVFPEPTVGCRMVIGADTFDIRRVETIPGGYILTLRR